jgi:hypothetical protein
MVVAQEGTQPDRTVTMKDAKKENNGGGMLSLSGKAKPRLTASAGKKTYENILTCQMGELAYGNDK